MSTIVKVFNFNDFNENTYVISDETKHCVIIDPGCNSTREEETLLSYLSSANLKPVLCLNTHCHIDHVLGNAFIFNKFGLLPWFHESEMPVLEAAPEVARMYGITYQPSPSPAGFIFEGQKISFGCTEFEVLFTPGHSPGSVSFLNRSENYLVSGDVLFENSIGRTDLPGGSFDVLMHSIREKLLPLGDQVKVYAGHGPATNIGDEKIYNPFLRQ